MYNIPIGSLANIGGSPFSGALRIQATANIQLQPSQLYDFNGKLYASDPTASRTIRYYKSLDELALDYDSLKDGDQVYIYAEAIPGAVKGQSYGKGATRGSIAVVTAIIYATLIIIVAIAAVAIISSLTTLTATIRKTPVTNTKPVGNNATAVTAPDGTVWIIDNVTGKVISESVPAMKYIEIISGVALVVGGTFAVIKYVVPWLQKK